jgi:hypothetical protein
MQVKEYREKKRLRGEEFWQDTSSVDVTPFLPHPGSGRNTYAAPPPPSASPDISATERQYNNSPTSNLNEKCRPLITQYGVRNMLPLKFNLPRLPRDLPMC